MAALDTRRRAPGGSTPARRQWAARLAGLLTLAALSCAPAIEAAPLEVYGRLPRLENVALSPDGSRIAFVKTEGNTRLVAVMSVADHSMMRSEEHTSELQSLTNLVCRLLLEKKKSIPAVHSASVPALSLV